MRSVKVTVRGLVQGVGFRWFTRDLARARGISGWVRNHADGSVEALLHGDQSDVDAVIAALHDGPPFARVDSVAVSDAEDPRLNGFEIRR